MKLKNVCMGIAIALLAGCAAPRMNTPSGAPEVSISGTTVEHVRSALVNHLLSRNWQIRSTDQFQIIAEQEGGMGQNIMLGSTFNPTTRSQLRLTVVEQNAAVRVLFREYVISNPGSGFQRELEVWGGWQKAQAWLEKVKAANEIK